MKYLLIIIFSAAVVLQAQTINMTKNELLEIPKVNFDAHGELIITPTSTSSKNDFDFYQGKWKLHNRKLNLG